MLTLPFTDIEIDGFRGLRQLQLKQLSRVNVFIGENNCGKTSILEAISLLCKPFTPEEWLFMVRRRDYGRLDETRLQSIRWSFSQNNPQSLSDKPFHGKCYLVCDGAFPLRELKVTYRELMAEPPPDPHIVQILELAKRHPALFEEIKLPDLQEKMSPPPELSGELRHDLNWEGTSVENIIFRVWRSEHEATIRTQVSPKQFLKTETLAPYSYQVNQELLQHYSRSRVAAANISTTEQDSSAMNALVQAFDPDVTGLEVLSLYGERPSLYINHRKLGRMPLSCFGDAMRRAVLLATTLFSLRGGVLLIDEVEVGIHIKGLARVFAWLVQAAKTCEVQLFVTTHSLEALDALLAALPDAEKEAITAFHVQQSTEQTECKRYAGSLLQRLRTQRGFDIR